MRVSTLASWYCSDASAVRLRRGFRPLLLGAVVVPMISPASEVWTLLFDDLSSVIFRQPTPMYQKVLLVGVLSVWLKRCVVSSSYSDVVLPTVLLLVVRLAHDRSLGLLPAMVCCIQRGLRALTEVFCRSPTTKRGKETILPRDGLNPRIGLPYNYLMAWFSLHCPAIIQAGEEPPEGVRVAHLCRFEGSSWSRIYEATVRKLLCRYDVYGLFQCFPYIRDAGYGEEFKDVGTIRHR